VDRALTEALHMGPMGCNVDAIVADLRRARNLMVQAVEQYVILTVGPPIFLNQILWDYSNRFCSRWLSRFGSKF
jgi:hypothetical protein